MSFSWIRLTNLVLFSAFVVASNSPLLAQQKEKKKDPPTKYQAKELFVPSDEVMAQIREKTTRLRKAVGALRRQGVRDPLLADVEVFERAGDMMLEHREFFRKDSAAMTLGVLDKGLLRARMLSGGDSPWANAVGQTVVRGYRSRIDGTVQPIAITYPETYGQSAQKRWRVDVVLHGRNATLTEAGFIAGFSEKPVPADQGHFVRIDVFGRGNNAYRWAGETDVLEAIDAFFACERVVGRGGLPDPGKVVLRGFSMGGAGTWHLGLHWPDRWAVMGPGAGFTTTHGYVPSLPEKLNSPQEECLRIYDAVDYVENAANLPIIAYSGEKDAQKQAADNIEAALNKAGMKMVHIVAPGLGHSFPPEWFKKADVFYDKHAQAGRPEYPKTVRFVTYTMKYPGAAWVAILGLQKHYEKTTVDAAWDGDGFMVKTANVSALHLTLPDGVRGEVAVTIDGQNRKLRTIPDPVGGHHVYLSKKSDGWHTILPQRLLADRARQPRKVHGLQGPIDDAFAESFVCVRGSGPAWNESVAKAIDARLTAFEKDWSKHWRGKLPTIRDVDLSAEDIAQKNLVLFGDPSSNEIIRQVLDALPVTWTKERVRLGAFEGPADSHIPVLIFPNPLNPGRYVVLNSGPTIPSADYVKTNAMLFPRLGDYAILRIDGDSSRLEPISAGLFDELWRIPKGK